MPNFGFYLKRAIELPPRVVAAKAARLALRSARNGVLGIRDRVTSCYGSPIRGNFAFEVRLTAEAVPDPVRAALKALATRYLEHRFDILGSGFVDVGYGNDMAGMEGVRYELDPADHASDRSTVPWRLVPRASRSRSKHIYSLIDDPTYAPIDWQRDMRSGYRWQAGVPWRRLRIGIDRGADIKMPWELSRMQHLPQLAIVAILAQAGDPRFGTRDVYAREIRNEILDFLSANPPRHGACWGCPMDVGIRAANWVLSLGLLRGAGMSFDSSFNRELLAGLHDASTFISANLEWSEQGRSNHYLSNLVGLLFAAVALPRTLETETWINFAARELCSETLIQFHADGGNYEGSTGYHRLSAELAVYGLALAAGLHATEPRIFERADTATLAKMRAPMPVPEEPFGNALQRAGERLGPILAFAQAIRRPDGDIVQIGDTDSGRLFKLTPALEENGDGAEPAEAQLRIDELIDVLAQLTGAAPPTSGAAGAVAAALCGGTKSMPARRPDLEKSRPPEQFGGAESELVALKRRIASLPQASQRIIRFDLPEPIRDPLSLAAFPDFGLYCLTGSGVFLAFRCAPHHRSDAPSGHTHDDNLGLELIAGDYRPIVDPGSYVYTSFPELRNAYRSHAAHFVPRAREFPVTRMSPYLFTLEHLLRGRCLAASPHGFAGVLEGQAGRIYRLVEVAADAVTVYDGIEDGSLCDLNSPPCITTGYGKKTARPAFAV